MILTIIISYYAQNPDLNQFNIINLVMNKLHIKLSFNIIKIPLIDGYGFNSRCKTKVGRMT